MFLLYKFRLWFPFRDDMLLFQILTYLLFMKRMAVKMLKGLATFVFSMHIIEF